MTNEGKQQSVLLLTGCPAYIRAVGTWVVGHKVAIAPPDLTTLEAKSSFPKDLVLLLAPQIFRPSDGFGQKLRQLLMVTGRGWVVR